MTTPHITPAALARQTFASLMRALSNPGRAHLLPEGGLAAFAALAGALLDIETSYYTDDPALEPTLARTGGRALPPSQARYQFYRPLSERALGALDAAPRGSSAYPDESATLVLGCGLGAGRRLGLSGPGLAEQATLWVEGVPDAFWRLRARSCRFPRGWDVFLVAERQVVGLPRTTAVEVL